MSNFHFIIKFPNKSLKPFKKVHLILIFFIASSIKTLFFKPVWVSVWRIPVLRWAWSTTVWSWTAHVDEHRVAAYFDNRFKIEKKIRFFLSKTTIPGHDKPYNFIFRIAKHDIANFPQFSSVGNVNHFFRSQFRKTHFHTKNLPSLYYM